MKRIVTLLTALVALVISYSNPAAACTRHTGVKDFTYSSPSNFAQDLVFGNVTIQGINTVAACDAKTQTLDFFRNGLNPEFYTSLPADTRVCLREGNDKVRVVRSGETYGCGTYTIRPLAYGGKKLIIVGMAGADTLSGGDGVDVISMYDGATAGSGTDIAGSGVGNDELWFSSQNSSRAFGGSGSDRYFSFSGAVTASAQDLSGGSDVYNGNGATVDRFCDVDGMHAGAYCGNTAGDRVNFLLADISCPFDIVCASIGSAPNGDR